MHKVCDQHILSENVKEIANLIDNYKNPTIWAAWGTLIEKRGYLKKCLCEIDKALEGKNCKWITIGNRSKKGHPHHPLYLKTVSHSEPFDIKSYIKLL